jgi:hypothetical protein
MVDFGSECVNIFGRCKPRITETADTESADTVVLLYLFLLHGNNGYVNAPQYLVYTFIVSLLTVFQ